MSKQSSEEVIEKREYIPQPPRPWIRDGFNKAGEQLWSHASDAQIKEAKEQGLPVHLCFNY